MTKHQLDTFPLSCGHEIRLTIWPRQGDELWCTRCDKGVTVTIRSMVPHLHPEAPGYPLMLELLEAIHGKSYA